MFWVSILIGTTQCSTCVSWDGTVNRVECTKSFHPWCWRYHLDPPLPSMWRSIKDMNLQEMWNSWDASKHNALVGLFGMRSSLFFKLIQGNASLSIWLTEIHYQWIYCHPWLSHFHLCLCFHGSLLSLNNSLSLTTDTLFVVAAWSLLITEYLLSFKSDADGIHKSMTRHWFVQGKIHEDCVDLFGVSLGGNPWPGLGWCVWCVTPSQ